MKKSNPLLTEERVLRLKKIKRHSAGINPKPIPSFDVQENYFKNRDEISVRAQKAFEDFEEDDSGPSGDTLYGLLSEASTKQVKSILKKAKSAQGGPLKFKGPVAEFIKSLDKGMIEELIQTCEAIIKEKVRLT